MRQHKLKNSYIKSEEKVLGWYFAYYSPFDFKQTETVPEMVASFSLAESTSRYNTYSSLFQKFHAIEHIRCHFVSLRECILWNY